MHYRSGRGLYRAALSRAREAISVDRDALIAIDGVTGAGKSTLARFIAWRLGATNLELDLCLERKDDSVVYDCELIQNLMARAAKLGRPIIASGISAEQVLMSANVIPALVIEVRRVLQCDEPQWLTPLCDYCETTYEKLPLRVPTRHNLALSAPRLILNFDRLMTAS